MWIGLRLVGSPITAWRPSRRCRPERALAPHMLLSSSAVARIVSGCFSLSSGNSRTASITTPVDGVSLELAAGEALALVGESVV